jgi:hypothetical protein
MVEHIYARIVSWDGYANDWMSLASNFELHLDKM